MTTITKRLIKYHVIAFIIALIVGLCYDFSYVHPDHKTDDEWRALGFIVLGRTINIEDFKK